jgi:hypothetical protein
MPSINGISNNPAGRGKGTLNKSTKSARESIALFVDGNADRLSGWLDQIAEDNPKQAFDCFMSVVEYHIPKLNRYEAQIDTTIRVEHTADDQAILERYLAKRALALQSSKVEATEAEFVELPPPPKGKNNAQRRK